MTKEIKKGRYTANIRKNGADGSFIVIVTRDGDCLHGIPSRSYANMKRATTGANKLLVKAGA